VCFRGAVDREIADRPSVSCIVMMMLSHVSVCADLHDVDGAAQASAQRRWLRLSRQM
jgi:hypothetical protein